MAIQSFPSAILWDVDGVLADTTEIHFKAWQSALAEVQVLLSKDQFLSLFGRSPSDTIKGIIGPEFSEIERKRIQCRKIELYNNEIKNKVRSTPGVEEWLKLFHHPTRQAVASSAPLEDIQFILACLHFQDYFEKIVSGSSLVESKPAPFIFLNAAKELG